MRTIAAGKFKATCLGLLDEVEAKREPVIVTKNGRAVAQLVPMPLDEPDPIFGFYKGKLEIVGDIVSPLYTDEENEEFFERSAAQLNDRS
jgi:prevent-host-death family protein